MQRDASRLRPISELRDARTSVVEVVAIAGVLAVSVNLASSVLSTALSTLVSGVVSAILLFVVVVYVIIRYIWPRNLALEIKSALPVLVKDNYRIANIFAYHFVRDFRRTTEAIFNENTALGMQWKEDPLDAMYEHKDSGSTQIRTTLGARLVNEIAEYLVLELLSTHLTDYFNSRQFDQSRLRTLERKDVPDIVLSNRALETISRDPADRPAFADRNFGKNITSASAGTHAYSRFDLTLPRGAVISRSSDGELQISTKGLKLTIACEFQGLNVYMPSSFDKHYLKISDFRKLNWFDVPIRLLVKVNLTQAILGRAWPYQEWVESFLQKCRDEFDMDRFLSRIQWDSIEASLIAFDKNGQGQSES